ncbi:MAG: SRPBCC domain-containing protein [Acidobacteriota bacterium]
MSDPTNDPDAGKAVFRIDIRGTIDDVWTELVRTDGPQRAMFNTVLHTDGVAPGGQLRMRSLNGRYTGVVGEYLTVERPMRLSHTMRFTNFDDPPATIVYHLEDLGGSVRVTMTVENIPVGTKSAKQLRQGGPFILKNLKAILETGKPTLGARILYVLFGLLEPLSPASSRSEHWPVDASLR